MNEFCGAGMLNYVRSRVAGFLQSWADAVVSYISVCVYCRVCAVSPSVFVRFNVQYHEATSYDTKMKEVPVFPVALHMIRSTCLLC